MRKKSAKSQLDVKPDTHLTYLLAKVSQKLQLVLDRALLRHEGITLTQFSALAHIGRSPGLSGADLARVLLTTPQATATLVRRLIRLGLVERPVTSPGAASAMRLTERGLSKLQLAEDVALETERRALSALLEGEQQYIATALTKLLRSLEEPLLKAAGEGDTPR
ncbi:MarR family winged helix-turn-helix transcriptional regulator [Mycobacterium sp. ML4]